MALKFTVNDWNDNIKMDDGSIMKGIVITQNDHPFSDPIIQVYEQQEGEPDHYHLIYQPGVVHVGVSSVEIVLLAPKPFNGKVVIK